MNHNLINQLLLLIVSLLITSPIAFGARESDSQKNHNLQKLITALPAHNDLNQFSIVAYDAVPVRDHRFYRSEESYQAFRAIFEDMNDLQKLNALMAHHYRPLRFRIIREMVQEKNIDPNTIVYGSDNITALFDSALSNNLALTQLLLQQKANVLNCYNGITIDTNPKDTLLILASYNNNTDIVQLLLNAGAHVNIQGSFNMTALMWAVHDPASLAIIKMLIFAGARLDLKDQGGHTALDMTRSEIKSFIEATVQAKLFLEHENWIVRDWPTQELLENELFATCLPIKDIRALIISYIDSKNKNPAVQCIINQEIIARQQARLKLMSEKMLSAPRHIQHLESALQEATA